MKNAYNRLLAPLSLGLLLALLGSCYPPSPPDDPETISSVLTLDGKGFAEWSVLVNDEAAEWDASGRAVYESLEAADYVVEALNAPEGETLIGFWVGLSYPRTDRGEGSVGELCGANPLHLHIDKTSLIVWPVYESDRERLSVMARAAPLPEGIVLP